MNITPSFHRFPDPAKQFTTLRLKVWRAVEAQRHMATRKLVDHLEEHLVLEKLLAGSLNDGHPSADVPGVAGNHAHYLPLHELLYNPFRYPPLRYGSRFGTRQERGIWYGALRISTVLAEVAYYRLRFLHASAAELAPVSADYTLFQAQLSTAAGIDLNRPPYVQQRNKLSHPADYRYSQQLGAQMRRARVEAFKFSSARDPRQGPNVGVYSPSAFAVKRPLDSVTWHSVSSRGGVEFRHSLFRITRWFPLEIFLVDAQLPIPS